MTEFPGKYCPIVISFIKVYSSNFLSQLTQSCSLLIWVKGSPLEAPANRRAACVARNILEGAATISRANLHRFTGGSSSSQMMKPEIKEFLA